MSASRRSIVVLGMVTKMPVPGVLWQTLHYLVGLRRLGYDVLYVEDHARSPSMFVGDGDSGSVQAARFLNRFLSRYDMADSWAFRALHDDGRVFGRTRRQLLDAYESADLILNLHGGTHPRPEHARTGRLVYVGTDPVQLEIELWQGRGESFDFLDQHCAIFTFGENLGNPDCGVPVPDRYQFMPTRQPVVLDFWRNDLGPGSRYTTIANWHQPCRTIRYKGEVYSWTKDEEFRKVLDLPRRVDPEFELALGSIEPAEQRGLEARGWAVRPAQEFGTDLDAYRGFIQASRGEFTVAKDQNVRLRSGWFSDRSATYLAAGRPVVTQDTGFAGVLPVGEGLFPFATIDEAVAAIQEIERDPQRASLGAYEVAREAFDSTRVLGRMLTDLGVEGPARALSMGCPVAPAEIPGELDLTPVSRKPLRLRPETERSILARARPSFASAPAPAPSRPLDLTTAPNPAGSTTVIVVTHGNLSLNRLCLESLLLCTDRQPFEVVVVDNASSDGTVDYLLALAASDRRVRLILNPENRGFAAACNQGAGLALGDSLVFLNNDTAVTSGWLDGLVAHLADETVGAVNPVTNRIGTEAEVESSPRTFGEYLNAAADRRSRRAGESRSVKMLAFFCLAIRRSTYVEIGPLDEQFGLGLFEDDDYSERLKQVGYRLLCAEDVQVHHLGEASFGHLVEDGRYGALFERNRKRFEAKWNRPWHPHSGGPKAQYRDLVRRLVSDASLSILEGATVGVVSRGDDRLIEIPGVTAWHFPLDPDGAWAGHYPANDQEAVAQLEALRQRGARYLLLPATAFWWLEHYEGLHHHLLRSSKEVMSTEDLRLFELGSDSPSPLRPVFVIGSPRSGTSILTWALGQHPNLYPLEETVWFGRFHEGLRDAFELGSSRGDRSQLSAMGITRSEFVEAFGRTVDDLIQSHRQWPAGEVGQETLFARARSPRDPKNRWVDGTPENSFFVDGLAELFPDARFIHLLREPRGVVRSLRRFDRIGGRRHTTNEAYQRWLRHVTACLDVEDRLGNERVVRVAHSQLVHDPETALRTCLEFIGEAFDPGCLLPLSERINSSGQGGEELDDEDEVDGALAAEVDALEAELFGEQKAHAIGGGVG